MERVSIKWVRLVKSVIQAESKALKDSIYSAYALRMRRKSRSRIIGMVEKWKEEGKRKGERK